MMATGEERITKSQDGEAREALAQLLSRASATAFLGGARGSRELGLAQADAILARYTLEPVSPEGGEGK